jgi:hypothetical protein
MIIAFLIWAIVATVVALYLYDLTVRRYKVVKVKLDELLEQSQERTQQLEINLHNANSNYEESHRQHGAALRFIIQLKNEIEALEADRKMYRHLYRTTSIALNNRNKQLAHAESWKARYRKQIQQLKDQKP